MTGQLNERSLLAMWIVSVDEWTAEWAIIASNVNRVRVDDWTAEWAIIVSNVYGVSVDD